ncbi:hypothetical protein MHL39_12335, partial [Roseomonas mucosa]|uniref:hypothetical protein n=1 Tax=Roseomonas mucosa TaxID=207340 RepID=UPI001EF40ECF
MVEALADASAELFQAQAETRDVCLSFGLGRQLLFLGSEGLLPLFEVTASAAIFIEAHHTGQVDLGQSLDLLRDADLPAPEGLAARSQFLRQPVAAMSPLKRVADRLRIGQELAEILPDEGLHLTGRNEPGGAWSVPMGVHRRELAAAAVVAV